MNNQQTVLLNGRHYNALTGKLVKDISTLSRDSSPLLLKLKGVKHSKDLRTLEGVIAHKFKTGSSLGHRHSVAPHLTRTAQHTKTLMRDAVKSSKISHVAKTTQENLIKKAKEFSDSNLAQKLNDFIGPPKNNLSDPQRLQTTANSEAYLKKLEYLKKIENDPASDEIFSEAALKLSDSNHAFAANHIKFYETLADKLRLSVKMLFAVSLTVMVLVVGGISSLVFSNNISMYVSDLRTGVHGILPTYIPSGYKLNAINYATGQPTGSISLDYVLSSNPSQYYQIEEQNTTWNSQELVQSVVQPSAGNNFKTYQVGGRNIFIYGKAAVWIDSGIYYMLSNHSSLTNAQVNEIANTT